MLKFVFTLLLFAFTSIAAEAQHTITKRDYDRAVSFRWNNVKSLAHNLEVTPHWFSDSTGFWYISTDEKGKEYQQYTFNGYIKAPLFDHLRFADSLSEILNEKIDPWKLPNRNTEVVDNTSIQFEARDKTWRLNTADYSISEFTPKAPTTSVEIKGKWRAFTQDYNIWVEDTTTGQKHQLSTDGRKDFEYASYYGWFDKMHGESSERPLHFYVNWSENGQFLKVDICDTRNADKMYMLDYGVDSLYRPNLLSYYRGSPGDTNMVKMQTIFFNMNTLQKVDIDLPVTTHITTPRYIWSDEPGIIYAINDHRGYLQKDIVKIDLNKARIETLFREESKIGIDDFKLFIHEDKKVIHFLSERSGWRQLHEYNLRNGKIKNISNGQYYIQDILKWDFENDLVYFTASGREQLTIPYYHKLYSTSLKNGHTELLTPENGHHDVHISLNGEFIVDNISMVMQPTYTTLRDLKTGAMLSDVSRAEISKLRETGWKAPLTFQCIGRDGETPIYAAIWRPSNFNPNKKYPVIDHSYTGPHTQAFPKSFKESLYTPNQAIAELGFIVVRIDGMGTAQRSLAFRSASYKNMGANLEDHVIAIKAMAKQFSWIDSDRVGVFGHSAGGYDAGHAVLAYPDFYKVAVASSADHDFRMEKAWWPEMYMGWPVDSTYEAVSNITMAGSLKGKLLLVHGALDDNVNVSATYKLAEALIKYDKEFDLLILPSQKHGFKDEHLAYFRKKRWNYFVEHLLGAEPIWGFDVDGKAEPTDEVILQGLISD
ncbi:MAG: dipeptidyl-peptidase-4, partial [Limisphaerales bacterium]